MSMVEARKATAVLDYDCPETGRATRAEVPLDRANSGIEHHADSVDPWVVHYVTVGDCSSCGSGHEIATYTD